jgi:hypothetical protein
MTVRVEPQGTRIVAPPSSPVQCRTARRCREMDERIGPGGAGATKVR